ncbi:MAG: hypothetical protein DBX46_04440 [Clostridiales bacterium]|mgnify:CR=1 FL=1|nr:MAG: hypothetical protein DBX46_04440 [Clostridiales bacterium]
MEKTKELYARVWNEYEKGLRFHNQMDLNDTVTANENFFIGKQWEGVEANGLPTPVFNFLKRVVLFTIAGITSDNLKMQATPLKAHGDREKLNQISDVVNTEFESLFERNKMGSVLREYMRNAAVDGDGCTYTYWDADVETGQDAKGAIVTEIVENNRVFFGNPNDRRVQKQPYIIISSREMVESVKKRAPKGAEIQPDTDERNINSAHQTDDKVTVLLKMWREDETDTIWACECTKTAVVRDAWDMGLSLYPVTWTNWDYVQDNYHGMAMITGLIPNQIFINKLFAMSMISLMTTAYPKIVYDKTRVPKWDNRVGAAIGINGGDVNSVAKIIDPAQISPQIAQFIQLAIDYTQTFLGATSVALGDTRPDNTSAIIALQRAAAVPNEITKQNLYQAVEDLGRIYIDFMAGYYGTRVVETEMPKGFEEMAQFAGMAENEKIPVEFDFSELSDVNFSLKLDVGASSYWSEIASMQTLDNLLMQGKIELTDYLERVPDGYISKRQELLDKLKGMQNVLAGGLSGTAGGGPAAGSLPDAAFENESIPEASGYSQLQRKINKTGL